MTGPFFGFVSVSLIIDSLMDKMLQEDMVMRKVTKAYSLISRSL